MEKAYEGMSVGNKEYRLQGVPGEKKNLQPKRQWFIWRKSCSNGTNLTRKKCGSREGFEQK